MHPEEWAVTKCHLTQLHLLRICRHSVLRSLLECCGKGTECWYSSITLNKPLMSVLKNISQIVFSVPPRVWFAAFHRSPAPIQIHFRERNHDPLKILTAPLMRTRSSAGWGGSQNWSWKFAESEKVWAARQGQRSKLKCPSKRNSFYANHRWVPSSFSTLNKCCFSQSNIWMENLNKICWTIRLN